MSALAKHDMMIARHIMRGIFSRWADLLTLVFGVPILLLIIRAGLADLPDRRVAFIIFAVLCLFSFTLVRFVFRRLHYHRTDGVLAVFALKSGEYFQYSVLIIGVGFSAFFAILFAIGMVNRLYWPLDAVVGMGAGMGLGLVSGALWSNFELREIGLWSRFSPILALDLLARNNGQNSFRNRAGFSAGAAGISAAGIFAAMLLVLSHYYFAPPNANAVAVAISFLAVLAFGRVNAEKVCFMAMVGHSSAATIRLHIQPVLCFFLPLSIILFLTTNMILGGIATGFAFACVAISIIRILAYRIFSQKMADWVVTIVISFIITVIFFTPFAAPVIYVMAVIRLGVRAKDRSWLLV